MGVLEGNIMALIPSRVNEDYRFHEWLLTKANKTRLIRYYRLIQTQDTGAMIVQLQMASEIAPPEEGETEGCINARWEVNWYYCHRKCHWGCDYCPLSDNRRETPDMFANERRCSNFDEVIEEGRAMNATGTGITGGDNAKL